jgi:hypothetical protein
MIARKPRIRKERNEQTAKDYFLELCAAYYDDLQATGKNAPHGQFLNNVEAVVLDQGQELLRQSFEILTQDTIDEIEKKKETRLCPQCQTKKRHSGNPKRKNETSIGTINVTRRYDECVPCHLLEHVVDEILGLDNTYTVGIRRLAVRAGGAKAFMEAEDDLLEYRGLKISHMTIRKLCQEEAMKMQEWQETSSEIQKDFIASRGVVEVTMDATKVNTTEGWKDAKICLMSVREFGDSASVVEWATRQLPRPNVRVAFSAIEGKELFQQRVNDWRRRLCLGSKGDISTLGDGAEWIWNISRAVFGNVRECLDVFHGLEHLSDTGKVLYGEGTAMYAQWQEETKMEFLREGFSLIEERLDRLEREKLEKGEEWEPREREVLRKLRGYLQGQSSRLNYRERLLEGRAIGSGQVEGACKHMIGRRLKQTGAKWLVSNLNRMTVICSVRYSSHWKKYWKQAK